MKIKFINQFHKQFYKLPKKQQQQFDERILLFVRDKANPVLRFHPLKGMYAGYYSINISGDLRALFYKEGEKVVIFALIGTHSQLYG